jgi:hypothetical protein
VLLVEQVDRLSRMKRDAIPKPVLTLEHALAAAVAGRLTEC